MIESQLKTAARQAAKVELVKGVLWFIGGVIVTAVTYMAAEPGGTYVLFWGAMAYGGYRLVRALYYWATPTALIKRFLS